MWQSYPQLLGYYLSLVMVVVTVDSFSSHHPDYHSSLSLLPFYHAKLAFPYAVSSIVPCPDLGRERRAHLN